MKILIKNLLVVFLGTLFCALLLFTYNIVVTNDYDLLYLLYVFIMAFVQCYLLTYTIFNIFDFIKVYSLKKTQLFVKLRNQLLLSFVYGLIVALIIVLLGCLLNGSFNNFIDSLERLTLLIAFMPITVTIDYLLLKYRKSASVGL